MKKLKRLLIATLAMMLVLVMMPAQTMRTVQAEPTIDTTQNGSLTLYKYEFKNSTPDNLMDGTGKEGETIPTGATLIDGVGFTLYKISNLDDYYNAGGNSLPTGEPNLADATKIGEEKLTASGKVTWENLELGIYYVVESTPPISEIGNTLANFYVSIPMTTVDGNDWLYDVVVYPKNTTSYAGITLNKTGNGTIFLENANFVLQKKISDDIWAYVGKEGESYTYKIATLKNDAFTFVTSNVGTVSIEGLAHGTYRFVETVAPDGYIMDETIFHEFYIHTNGKVYPTKGDADANTNENTSKTITVNNEKPDIKKEIKNIKGTWQKDADYSVGDIIPFRIIVDVPSNIEKLKTFIVTDTMSAGLENASNFAIKGYETVDMSDDGTEIGTVTPSISGQTWKADFSDKVLSLIDYKKIVITYNATLNASAVIAGTGNPNDVTLEYSNQILTDADEPPTTSTLTDRAVVYSFKIELTKQFAGATDASGEKTYSATFQLYRKCVSVEVAGTTLTAPGEGTIDVVMVGTPVTLTKNSNSDPIHTFSGLENGEYYLVETSTAPGYNLLKEPVKVVISLDYETINTTNDNGTITTETKYYASSDMSHTEPLPDVTESTTIINNKGFTLPVTGGMGMFSFIIVGVSMMIAAVILFITSKKKEATEK